jgi:ATP-dependent Clp protease ATP-binding subunit ClpB
MHHCAHLLAPCRQHLEPDPALARRFQPVLVSEPSEAEALACLHGLRQRYELHHGVAFSEGALSAAVACGKR